METGNDTTPELEVVSGTEEPDTPPTLEFKVEGMSLDIAWKNVNIELVFDTHRDAGRVITTRVMEVPTLVEGAVSPSASSHQAIRQQRLR